MSQTLYESLFDASSGPDVATDLVRAFARSARVHRVAHDLATDEMMEGMWVAEEMSLDEDVRLAADDRSAVQAFFTADGYVVDLVLRSEGQWVATQVSGPGGASLRIGSDWVVLTPGVAVEVPVTALPDSLVLVDLQGREITLKRS